MPCVCRCSRKQGEGTRVPKTGVMGIYKLQQVPLTIEQSLQPSTFLFTHELQLHLEFLSSVRMTSQYAPRIAHSLLSSSVIIEVCRVFMSVLGNQTQVFNDETISLSHLLYLIQNPFIILQESYKLLYSLLFCCIWTRGQMQDKFRNRESHWVIESSAWNKPCE